MTKRLWLGFIPLLILSGCNFYGGIDSPSGDAQILAAARACFDRGDLTCASDYYGRLSSTSSDQSNSEIAFEMLAQSGFTMSNFMTAVDVGSTDVGKLITKLASSISSNAGQTSRLNIFHAYQKHLVIQNTTMKGLVRFIGATALLAEILSEDAGSNGLVDKSDFVTNPTTCVTYDVTTAAGQTAFLNGTSGCEKPAGKTLVDGTFINSLTTATDTALTGNPSLYMINACIEEIYLGLVQMGITGGVSLRLLIFTDAIIRSGALFIGQLTDSPLYRQLLINQGVGNN